MVKRKKTPLRVRYTAPTLEPREAPPWALGPLTAALSGLMAGAQSNGMSRAEILRACDIAREAFEREVSTAELPLVVHGKTLGVTSTYLPPEPLMLRQLVEMFTSLAGALMAHAGPERMASALRWLGAHSNRIAESLLAQIQRERAAAWARMKGEGDV